MNKVVGLTALALISSPYAMADIVVYGSVRPSIEYSKISDNGSQDLTRTRLVDNSSRIGFKGTDKLDNGANLYWRVENRVYVGNGENSTGFNTRETYVGVKNNLGNVRVGKSHDLVEQSVNNYSDENEAFLPGFQYWNETVDSVLTFIGNVNAKHAFGVSNYHSHTRLNNLIQYNSPVMSGFQVKALYDFGAKTSAYNYKGYQAALIYKSKMFNVGGVYKKNEDAYTSGNTASAAEDSYSNYLIGGNLAPIKDLNISIAWSQTKTQKSSNQLKQTAWAIGANYATGKHGVGVHYGKIGDYKFNGVSRTDTGGYAMAMQYK